MTEQQERARIIALRQSGEIDHAEMERQLDQTYPVCPTCGRRRKCLDRHNQLICVWCDEE